MRYETGEPATLILDSNQELQAITWACSDMRSANPTDESALAAYTISLRGNEVRNDSSQDTLVLVGTEADVLLTTLRLWVESGLPKPEGKITDAARSWSYRTAKMIVETATEIDMRK